MRATVAKPTPVTSDPDISRTFQELSAREIRTSSFSSLLLLAIERIANCIIQLAQLSLLDVRISVEN
jgi:hypothetical protein